MATGAFFAQPAFFRSGTWTSMAFRAAVVKPHHVLRGPNNENYQNNQYNEVHSYL